LRPSRRRTLSGYVYFWHLADIVVAPPDVRFQGKSGHGVRNAKCPFLTHIRPLAGHRLAGHRYYNGYEPLMQIKALEGFLIFLFAGAQIPGGRLLINF
jgi:hypothetical protein